MKTRKELRDEFKAIRFRAGIFQIRNTADNRRLLQASQDLDRAWNSDVFQLNAGLHGNKLLQNDWNRLGAAVFEFSLVDELKIRETAEPHELKKELNELLELHLSELKSAGQPCY
jgi:hypothetical protein